MYVVTYNRTEKRHYTVLKKKKKKATISSGHVRLSGVGGWRNGVVLQGTRHKSMVGAFDG